MTLEGASTLGRILLAEDEAIVALDLSATLTDLGYSVVATAASGEEAVQKVAELRPDLVLMDIRLSGEVDGVRAAEAIRRGRDIPVIYLTAHSDEETLRRAKATAPFGYLLKPFRVPDLRCAIEIALHKHVIEARLREHEQWLDTTLRSIADGVVATDPNRRVQYLNPVAEALTGWTRQEALGRALEEVLNLVSEKARAPVESPVQHALRDKAATSLEDDTLLVAKNGTATPIDDSAAPILDDAGAVVGGVMVFRDATPGGEPSKTSGS